MSESHQFHFYTRDLAKVLSVIQTYQVNVNDFKVFIDRNATSGAFVVMNTQASRHWWNLQLGDCVEFNHRQEEKPTPCKFKKGDRVIRKESYWDTNSWSLRGKVCVISRVDVPVGELRFEGDDRWWFASTFTLVESA